MIYKIRHFGISKRGKLPQQRINVNAKKKMGIKNKLLDEHQIENVPSDIYLHI